MLTQETKDEYLERALAHQKADDFEKGYYWDGKKGCCVGCLAHKDYNAHQFLAKELESPEWIFHCADEIFEGLPLEESKQWPVDFIQAMPVGLSSEQWDKQIKAPFLVSVLESVLDTFDHDKYPDIKSAIDGSIALWKRDDIGTDEFREAAARAAEAAFAADAIYEARAAARAAEAAFAADTVYVARAAARAADAAANAAYAAGAARFECFASELLRLMREAK